MKSSGYYTRKIYTETKARKGILSKCIVDFDKNNYLVSSQEWISGIYLAIGCFLGPIHTEKKLKPKRKRSKKYKKNQSEKH